MILLKKNYHLLESFETSAQIYHNENSFILNIYSGNNIGNINIELFSE